MGKVWVLTCTSLRLRPLRRNQMPRQLKRSCWDSRCGYKQSPPAQLLQCCFINSYKSLPNRHSSFRVLITRLERPFFWKRWNWTRKTQERHHFSWKFGRGEVYCGYTFCKSLIFSGNTFPSPLIAFFGHFIHARWCQVLQLVEKCTGFGLETQYSYLEVCKTVFA